MKVPETIRSILWHLGLMAKVEQVDRSNRPFCFVVTSPQALSEQTAQLIREQVKFAIGQDCPPVVVMHRGMRLEVVPVIRDDEERRSANRVAIVLRHAADLTRSQLEQLESLRRALVGDDVGGLV